MNNLTNLKTWLVISMVLLGLVSNALGDIIYVDDDAPVGGDGKTWETAYKYLQDALKQPPSYGDEIWVAAGTYRPDDDDAHHPNGTGLRTDTFYLINGVAIAIYGGFPTGGGTWEQRDPNQYETKLSGDLNGNDVGFTNNGENSYRVVDGSDTNNTAILDGFTITAGNANDGGFCPACYDHGGGMFNWNGDPNVTNCTFSGNSAKVGGGGMFNGSYSSPNVRNCTFNQNSCDFGGGGMANDNGSSPHLTDCSFNENWAGDHGGGMANADASPTVTNCTFSGNSAEGTDTNDGGGGMYNHSSSPCVKNCTFIGNLAVQGGGGGMYNYWGSRPTLTNCIFSGNQADDGAGMCNHGSYPELIANCTFSSNGNEATDAGGAMYNKNYSNPEMLINCILWGDTALNGPEIYNDGTSSITVSYSDIEGCGGSGAGWDPNCGTDDGNNIDADPLFTTGPQGNFYLSQMAAGQASDSPCVDAGGGLASDWCGTTRTDEVDDVNTVDMGFHYKADCCTDNDGDGYNIEGGDCGPVDCDDTNENIFPGADELCNGVDDDCNPATPDGCDEPWYLQPTACGIGQCAAAGQLVCQNGQQVDTCIPGTPTGEVCDGLDNDCDGVVDNGGDALCDDGLWCNGQETCGGASGCQSGTPPNYDDGVDCTDDSCDEINDQCVNDPNDDNCAVDGWFDTGNIQWVNTGQCTEKEQKEQEYRDYYCDVALDCLYTVEPNLTQWVDTGSTSPIPNGTGCDDGNPFTTYDICIDGVCNGQLDSDGDGIPDANDNCWEVDNPDQSDSDSDCPAMPFATDPLCGNACDDDCLYLLMGDVNNDCKFDLLDLALMAANWLIDCDLTPGDPACVPK